MIPDVKLQLILHVQFCRNHFDSEATPRHPGDSAFRDAHRLLDAGEVDKEGQIHSVCDQMVAQYPNAGF